MKEILLTPDKLRDLDLDAFAEELERQEYGNKRTTLYDIRDELFGPYKERRSPFTPLTQVQSLYTCSECVLIGYTCVFIHVHLFWKLFYECRYMYMYCSMVELC